MDTDSFIVFIKKEGTHVAIAKKVEMGFDTLNYEFERSLPKGKNQKVIGLMKDELGGKTMTASVALRPKMDSHLTDDNDENEKAKGKKKCVIKRKLNFKGYKYCLEETQLENKLNQLQKNKFDVDSLGENHEEFIQKKINIKIITKF